MKQIKGLIRVGLTLIELALAILIISVTTQIIFGSSTKTLINTILSIILMAFTNIVWIPQGVEKAEKTAKVYNTTLRYNCRANYIINNHLFGKLKEFCVQRNEEYRIEKLTHKLGNYLIDYNEYIQYCELRKNALKTSKKKRGITIFTDKEFLEFRAKFTKKQKLILDYYAKNKVMYRKLKDKHLIIGHKASDGIVPINREKMIITIRIFGKVAWGLFLGLFSAYILFTKKDCWTINETIQVIIWAFSISMNVYTSIQSGYKSVYETRYEYYKDKNIRCAEFFAYCNIPIEEVEKNIQLISDKT